MYTPNIWHHIEFAEGKRYKLHVEDLKLFSNTGIWDLLDIRPNGGGILEPRNTYIPRYISTFMVFMHHLRGYEVNVKYVVFAIKNDTPDQHMDLHNFVKMLISDNAIYKVHSMINVLNDIAYMVCPKMLTATERHDAKLRKSPRYIEKCASVYEQLEEISSADKYLDMPHRYLLKKLDKAMINNRFEEFKTELNVKLPLVLITLVNLLGTLTGKEISPNFEQNIKQRIRNDPDLAQELYKKLTDLNILHTIRMIVSCLSAFVEL